ncbi:MAG: hypothetical protein OXG58_11495 [Gemmatimonadetes bacterium]|nr:hypothetical protein [Gemmatimonadota bacterium]MCY3943480.1 hypothetical protein [Gemmatimonadota bacterium]
MNEIIEQLAARGAHFVLCNEDKSPIGKAWQRKKRAVADVIARAGAHAG